MKGQLIRFTPKQILSNPLIFCAVGFGSGLLPKVPGTWGSVVALILYCLLPLKSLSPWWYIAFIAASFLAGCLFCEAAAKAIGVPDHGSIVWDEFVGLWLTFFLLPIGWFWLAAGFMLFRFFDIFKPFPIGIIDQKIANGFGIMLDDLIAGIYAFITLQILNGCVHWLF